jgi:hypothetical protein
MAYERFWAKVDKSADCWLWTGALTKGYGQLTHEKRHLYAHRFSWEIHNGHVPDGAVVCHRCDTPTCVRPDHLFLGTTRDNVMDCLDKGRANRRGLRGAENPAVKAKAIDARAVVFLFNAGWRVRELAPLFSVSKSTISIIVRGQHWSNQNGI